MVINLEKLKLKEKSYADGFLINLLLQIWFQNNLNISHFTSDLPSGVLHKQHLSLKVLEPFSLLLCNKNRSSLQIHNNKDVNARTRYWTWKACVCPFRFCDKSQQFSIQPGFYGAEIQFGHFKYLPLHKAKIKQNENGKRILNKIS